MAFPSRFSILRISRSSFFSDAVFGFFEAAPDSVDCTTAGTEVIKARINIELSNLIMLKSQFCSTQADDTKKLRNGEAADNADNVAKLSRTVQSTMKFVETEGTT